MIGLVLAYFALSMGTIFFLYSIRYYITLAIVLGFSRKASGYKQAPTTSRVLSPQEVVRPPITEKEQQQRVESIMTSLFQQAKKEVEEETHTFLPQALEKIELSKYPFVSIHLPFYNEKRVANRILAACTAQEYPNFEIVVVDDSTDETIQILKRWEQHPRVKVIHRESREGYKGGALQQALLHTDVRAKYILIFDADFVPYPDTTAQFIRYFELSERGVGRNRQNIIAVQGYQWHVLNKNENWITRGVRAEFAGSYVVERPGTEIVGALKQIAGSVYMIRADVLKKYGWSHSLTEDFELTLRLYTDGLRVLYTPYIQAPSECVATIRRLIRQRMRWAEGHTFNVKKYFWHLLRSPHLSKREKLEFLYLSPYYLQSFFFLTGTLAWFISDSMLNTKLPFWTALWGWSLVLTNLFALPLMNGVGIFLEEGERRDFFGVFSFILLTYIVAPFQAFAAIKGIIERNEGHWFRTPKSGHVTDVFFRSRFRRFFGYLFPGVTEIHDVPQDKRQTALNAFNQFGIASSPLRWIGNASLGFVTIFLVVLLIMMPYVPTNPSVTNSEQKIGFLKAQAANSIPRESIRSQLMIPFGDAEAIFHQEPRLRYKLGTAEIEVTTLNANGVGKVQTTDPYKEGPLFVYPEIFQNIDLIYRIRESRVNESFLMKNYAPLEYIEQRIRLTDLVVAKNDQGHITFAPKSGGDTAFEFQKPFMYEEIDPAKRSEALVYEMFQKGNEYFFRKTLTEEGKQWLADPSRQFPVVIDPTIVRSNVVASALVAQEAQFGSNQRKIAYMPNATGGAAWYAFHADGQIIRYKKCTASNLCDADGDWSANVNVDVDGDGGDGNPTIHVEGDTIWIAWIDNLTAGTTACCTAIDAIQWRSLNTTNDTFAGECSSDDQGTLDYTNFPYIAVGDNGDVVAGYSDTAGDTEADIFEVPTGTTCSTTPLNTDVTYTIETGSGLPTDTTTMRPVPLGLGNKIHVVYDDAANEIRHSIRDVSTNAWDSADTVADNGNVQDDIFSVATDGSSLWLLYRDTTTTTVLQKCASTCTTTWTNLTAPWTSGLTSADYPNIGYMSTENDLKACIDDGSSSTAQDVVCKSTDAASISWGSQFSIGFTAADFAELSLTMSVSNDTQMALVVNDSTNSTLKFATVPEKILFLFFVLPALPWIMQQIRRRARWKRT